MDARSGELLEYPLILERLVACAAFGPSQRLAAALQPSNDRIVVTRRLDETDEARWLLAERPDIGIGGARDIEPVIDRAAHAGRLDPPELWSVVETLITAGRLADGLREVDRPLLHALCRSIDALPSLRHRLETSIDPTGEILDTASPLLGGLRRGVRIAHERLRTRLEALVHSDLGSALQEPIVTLRNGRYVVPVRADAKSRVKGIVHDQSGSGQTLFVEPMVAVEMANSWREAQLAVRAEEERVLDELSAHVAADADALRGDLDALARFDLWVARARLSEELDAVRPTLAHDSTLSLLSARHPGLTGAVVPIDVHLGDGYTALVITGPNTGGKTVALRTVGLLALMHQAGMHVPVSPGSIMPLFDDVLADIGDEQSVAQSLSTFSGHLRTITRIVDQAGESTLVLLDELGAGTDPTEGSALAQSLLDHFIEAGALIVATTHYAELKTYAHNEPRARNASVEFDLATLAPTYHLSIGLPGTSQAFAIAERLGLPRSLVDDARSRLSAAQQEFETTLASIRETQADISASEARISDAELRMQAALREAEEERRRARAERRAATADARRQAEIALAAVEAEIAEMRGSLARETLTDARLEEAMARIDARLGALSSEEEPAAARDDATAHRWRIGEGATTASGWADTVAALDEGRGRATLQVSGMRVDVDLAELQPSASGGASASTPGQASRSSKAPATGRRGDFGEGPRAIVVQHRSPIGDRAQAAGKPPRAVPASLDLRGARVDEAMHMLDRYLDDAAHADAGQVTVIHGHGSGAMRDAVRRMLAEHPLVQEWRPGDRHEGGGGATIVSFWVQPWGLERGSPPVIDLL
ncbi:MAG: endonuclease MutS2, partial [Chloroflexota bacterium]